MMFFEKNKIETKMDIEKEVASELSSPDLEMLSNKFFKASTDIVGLRVSDGGAEGPYRKEYLEAAEDVRKILEEKGKEIALYSTKKAIKIKEKGGFWGHRNHWRYYFLKPEYLEKIMVDLDENEKSAVFEEINFRIAENLAIIERGDISAWEKEGANDTITTDRKNLQILGRTKKE